MYEKKNDLIIWALNCKKNWRITQSKNVLSILYRNGNWTINYFVKWVLNCKKLFLRKKTITWSSNCNKKLVI